MNQPQLQFGGDSYPQGFWYWLRNNAHIHRAFERMALEMAMSGREHYSARTIIEAIRWNTDLSDTDKQFKINNVYVPGLARLFMERHGERVPRFFQIRNSMGFDV